MASRSLFLAPKRLRPALVRFKKCGGGNQKPIYDTMFDCVQPPVEASAHKVSVIGGGSVGMASAVCIAVQGISSDIAVVDRNKDRIAADVKDLQQGAVFLRHLNLQHSTDFEVIKDSKVVVITAGARQEKGESRLALLQRNTEGMSTLVKQIICLAPDCVLVIVTNPVDVMAYVAAQVAGFPPGRVIGTGCVLDTARFRLFISQRLNIASTSCQGFIIGEHGDSSVPVWSSVSVAGSLLQRINPSIGRDDDKEKWGELHKNVIGAAYEIIAGKGYTNWAVALTVAHVTKMILQNKCSVESVSVNVKGYYGIEKDVFLSIPCVLGENGVTDIVKIHLDDIEEELFVKSSCNLLKTMEGIKL